MGNPIPLLLELFLVAAISFCAAFLIEFRRNGSRRTYCPVHGDVVRITCEGKVARCRFIERVGSVWRLSPPLSRDSEMTAPVGSPVAGSVGAPGGVVTFRTQLLSIDAQSNSLSLTAPRRTFLSDRREKPRQFGGGKVVVEGKSAELLDLSAWGARVKAEYRAKRGERVRVDFPSSQEPVFGWVLEVQEMTLRVRFEDALPLAIAK